MAYVCQTGKQSQEWLVEAIKKVCMPIVPFMIDSTHVYLQDHEQTCFEVFEESHFRTRVHTSLGSELCGQHFVFLRFHYVHLTCYTDCSY